MSELNPLQEQFAKNPNVIEGTQYTMGNGDTILGVDSYVPVKRSKVIEGEGATENFDTLFGAPIAKEQKISPTFGETLGAAFAQENTIGSFINYGNTQQGNYVDPNYDVFVDPAFLALSETEQMELFSSGNADYTKRVIANIQKQSENKRILAESGLTGVGLTMAVSLLEPADAVYLMMPWYKVGKAASVGNAAFKTGMAGGTSVAMQEALLQQQQALRTFEESKNNVIFSAAFAAGLGGAVKAFNQKGLNEAVSETKEWVEGTTTPKAKAAPLADVNNKPQGLSTGDSAGAARYDIDAGRSMDIEDYNLVRNNFAQKLALKTIQTPERRLADSPALVSRQAGMGLADSTLLHKGHFDGKSLIPSRGSIESRTRAYQGIVAEQRQLIQEHFFKYRKANAEGKMDRAKLALEDLKGASKDGSMTRTEFNSEVSDIVEFGVKRNSTPEAVAAAKNVKAYFKEMFDQAADVGLLDEADEMGDYLHRIWKQDRVKQHIPEMRNIIKDWISEQMDLEGAAEAPRFADDAELERFKGAAEQISKNLNAVKGNEALTDFYTHQKLVNLDNQKVASGEKVRSETLDEINEMLGDAYWARVTRVKDVVSDLNVALKGKSATKELPLDLPPEVYKFDKRYKQARKYVRHGKQQPMELKELRGQAKADVDSLNKLYDEWKATSAKQTDSDFAAFSRRRYLEDRVTRYELDKIDSDIRKLKRQQRRENSRLATIKRKQTLTDTELNSYAQKTIDNILGIRQGQAGASVLPPELASYASAFKQRKLKIPSDKFKHLDVLERDIERVMEGYSRTTSPQIEIARDFGDIQASDLFAKLDKNYDELIGSTTDPKKAQELVQQKEADIRDINVMLGRLQGTYGLPDDPTAIMPRAMRFVKNVNYSSSLGGMTISALPDAIRLPMKVGLREYAGHMKRMSNVINKEMAEWEVRRAGVANEFIQSSRARQMADIVGEEAGSTRLERGAENISDFMGNLSFMNQWNDRFKMQSGLYIQDSSLRAAKEMAETGKLSSQSRKTMGVLGIDDSTLKRIGQQFLEHGNDGDDLLIANTKAWTDEAAVQAFRSAIGRETNKIIIQTGIGDLPNLVGSPTSKFLLQFKSFPIAAQSRIFAAGVQQGDAAALGGFLASWQAGMITYMIKETLAGRADTIADTEPDQWVLEGVDRSGILGWMMEADNLINSQSGGYSPIQNLVQMATGQEIAKQTQLSRYRQRNTFNNALGAGAGFVQDIFTVSGAAIRTPIQGTEAWSEGDVNAFRRSLPYQNLFYLNYLLDQVQGKE